MPAIPPHRRRLPALLPALLLALLLPWSPAAAGAEANTMPPAVHQLQRFLDGLHTLSAHFTQITYGGDASTEMQESRGTLLAERPGRFRWDYREPFEQLIVSDGVTVWYYEPDLMQATRTPAANLEDSAAALLSDTGRPLGEHFRWEVVQDPLYQMAVVRLFPLRPDDPTREIAVTLHPEGTRILSLEVVDQLGHRSRFSFQAWTMNQPVERALFDFTPPPGVDVVER